MRVGGLVLVAAVLLGACGDAAAAPTRYRPVETEPMVIVTFPAKGAATPFVAPTLAAGSAVSLSGSVFDPTPLQVTVGTTVLWTNRDPIAHTVTSGVPGLPDGKWDSQLNGAGVTFAWTFTVAGTFPYYCRFHAGVMHGTIVVR
jgi:plastocyanin